MFPMFNDKDIERKKPPKSVALIQHNGIWLVDGRAEEETDPELASIMKQVNESKERRELFFRMAKIYFADYLVIERVRRIFLGIPRKKFVEETQDFLNHKLPLSERREERAA